MPYITLFYTFYCADGDLIFSCRWFPALSFFCICLRMCLVRKEDTLMMTDARRMLHVR